MNTIFNISDKDDIKNIIFKVCWNIREYKMNYDYEPTKEDIITYLKDTPDAYNKFIQWYRDEQLDKIL